ncbi:hypothetical protein J4433_01175 [Candidatus Pacearchaeota archaeon]|nr:hypothetical protein [Candidatus Pacearchaeota archaeon]
MEDRQKLLLIEGIIFAVLAAITLVELFNFLLFTEFFMRIKEYLSWFLGLSIGPLAAGQILEFKRKFDKARGGFLPNEKFVFFFANLILMTFAVGLVKQFFLSFLNKSFAFFHIITVQWLVVVYIWFKFANDFKIDMKYVITAEIFVILFSLIVTLAF